MNPETTQTVYTLFSGIGAAWVLWQVGRVALALLLRLWFWLRVWWGGLYRVQVARRMAEFFEIGE